MARTGRSTVGRGTSGVVVVDDVPPDPAPGPAAPGVAAGGQVAAGEFAAVGPPEGPVMVWTFWPEGVVVSVAVPEAAPETLGAWGAEERGLGLSDPHGRSLA